MDPHLQKEMALLKQGYHFVAGIDEAGRGAWAGPVVAAAVILPVEQADLVGQLTGLNDSKKLTAAHREHLFALISQTALTTAIGLTSAKMVDEMNVLAATRQAMREAVGKLSIQPDYLLVDYVALPQLNQPQQAFAKADTISLTVAAASIIAKVSRDRLMVQFSQQYPGYGFERHKGYGTALHREALAEYGPSPVHRLSFKPLQKYLPRLI